MPQFRRKGTTEIVVAFPTKNGMLVKRVGKQDEYVSQKDFEAKYETFKPKR